MKKLSRTFVSTLKLDPRPAYQIAQLASVDSNWISKAVHNAIPLREDDPRLQRLAEVLGLPYGQVFEGGCNE